MLVSSMGDTHEEFILWREGRTDYCSSVLCCLEFKNTQTGNVSVFAAVAWECISAFEHKSEWGNLT